MTIDTTRGLSPDSHGEDFTPQEKQERFLRTVQAALNTPPDHRGAKSQQQTKAAKRPKPPASVKGRLPG